MENAPIKGVSEMARRFVAQWCTHTDDLTAGYVVSVLRKLRRERGEVTPFDVKEALDLSVHPSDLAYVMANLAT